MGDQRKGGILWTEETWNPIRGCSRVSDGCKNCYAEAVAARSAGAGQSYEGTINLETGRWNGTVRLVPERLTDPLRWQRPRMIFVNSMSDLFHPDVPDEYIDKVFAVMALAKQHTFQILTKRPERMIRHPFFSHSGNCLWVGVRQEAERMFGTDPGAIDKVLPNVWLGVTVENQSAANKRIPLLLQTPAAVRWVSMEPLLGEVNLRRLAVRNEDSSGVFYWDGLTGVRAHQCGKSSGHPHLDWVVVGGESGANARPMNPDWARNLRDQCAETGVPLLFKQHGEWLHTPDGFVRVGKTAAGRLLDGVEHNNYPLPDKHLVEVIGC